MNFNNKKEYCKTHIIPANQGTKAIVQKGDAIYIGPTVIAYAVSKIKESKQAPFVDDSYVQAITFGDYGDVIGVLHPDGQIETSHATYLNYAEFERDMSLQKCNVVNESEFYDLPHQLLCKVNE